jgi:hypothetical protein
MARCCSGPSLYEAVTAAQAAEAGAEAALAEMEAALEAHPGAELGFAERTTNFTTTATATLTGDITGLSITVIGTGQPVDVAVYLPSVRHSVANTTVAGYLSVNGVTTGGQTSGTSSPSTTEGRTAYLKRRMVLTDTVSYTFQAGLFGAAAGTVTSLGNANFPMQIMATAR